MWRARRVSREMGWLLACARLVGTRGQCTHSHGRLSCPLQQLTCFALLVSADTGFATDRWLPSRAGRTRSRAPTSAQESKPKAQERRLVDHTSVLGKPAQQSACRSGGSGEHPARRQVGASPTSYAAALRMQSASGVGSRSLVVRGSHMHVRVRAPAVCAHTALRLRSTVCLAPWSLVVRARRCGV